MEKENVLVCVSYPESAAQLIARGMTEKKAFRGECIVLHVYDPEGEGSDLKAQEKRDEIQRCADQHKALMIFQPMENGKKLGEIIGEVARAHDVRHVIIGQAFRSRWDLLIHGSLVNELFHELDEVDVTIYKIRKDASASEAMYDRGVAGYLYKDDGKYKVALSEPDIDSYAGTFYQHLHTDFMTGLYKAKIGNHPLVVHVTQKEVDDKYNEELDNLLGDTI
ncbi:hypothetical protein [Alkalicoccus halolimnae]|uniref:Universal stress protein UspA n=1 Tax=Alkalicoccus halolimnae TaxID=1667239 RepID=A0A5C7F9L6_9BACI|nr:hypothetical protein [Alkalicoccus halolimnae]TXF86078.1 hypothetical protein FTX54_05520 [Alkalicoccus halolimnae]